MLLETQSNFVVVEPEADLSPYDVIVLTGAACLTEDEAAALNQFVTDGGGLLVLGESALDRAKQRFLLDVGATYVGPAEFDILRQNWRGILRGSSHLRAGGSRSRARP